MNMPSGPPAPPAVPAVARRLVGALGRLRRALNRRVRAASPADPLPEAQLELLRLVERRPSLRVQDAAGELMLASNTVSTLVHRLGAAGLLERETDPWDGRVVRLRLGPDGAERLRRWRDRRQEVLTEELRRLETGEVDAVVRALPVLERLATLLEGPGGGPAR
jgi:DNA-binding MarR family transcriptional regulator